MHVALRAGYPMSHRLRPSLCALANGVAQILVLLAGLDGAVAQCATAHQAGLPQPGLPSWVQDSVLWDADGPGPGTARLTVLSGVVKSWDDASQTWVSLPALPQSAGVRGLAATPDGSLYVSGLFYPLVPPFVPYMRWDGAAWRPPVGGISGIVMDMVATQGGDLLIAGWPLAVSGGADTGLARWDGSAWTAFAGVPNVQTVIELANGDIVVSGSFQSIGGIAASRIARWDGVNWSPLGTGTPGPARRLLQMSNGDIIATGMWSSVGGVSCEGIARWNGTAWLPLGVGVAGSIEDIAEDRSGDVLVTGALQSAGGLSNVGHTVRWDGSTWQRMTASGDSDRGYTITTLPGGDLAIGGLFANAAQIRVNHIARWDGAEWRTFGGGVNAGVRAMTKTAAGAVLAAGDFTVIEGTSAAGVASTTDGSNWTALGSGLVGAVHAVLALPNGDVIAAGDFALAGSSSVARIARWDGSMWSPLGTGIAATVFALALLPNGDIVAGGGFAQAGGMPAQGLARWDGAAWSPLGGGVSGAVTALRVLDNGHLLVGGSFGVAGSVLANNVARWDGASWSPLGAGTDGWVYALTQLADGSVLAGGSFTIAGGQATGPLARWNGGTWSSVGVPGPGVLPNPVRTIVEHPGGDVFLGGLPGALAPMGASIVRWDGATWQAAADTERDTRAMAFVGEVLVEGGLLSFGRGLDLPLLGKLVSSCPAMATNIATNCIGGAGPLTSTADELPWLGATFRASTSGFAPGAVGVGMVGLTSPNTPLTALHPSGLPGCALLASGEATTLAVPTAGRAGVQFVIPSDAALVGVQFFHQFLQAEIVGGALQSLSGSNALRLTVGTF